jgi:hypothetical protein
MSKQVRILDPAPVSFMLTQNKNKISAKARGQIMKIIRTYNNSMHAAFKNYEKACTRAVVKLENDLKKIMF